ncbi:MAG: hypothetical protein KUL85_11615 [Sphingobacterium mizutaii]|nr:hypothetical protein [Sphingobacterium mizutaii]
MSKLFFFFLDPYKKYMEKYSTPSGGFSKYINIHYPSEGSPLASGSFPMAEKWKECRCPVRWDWPWNAFKKFSI